MTVKNDLFNPEDFSSIRLDVTFKNLVAQTEISDPKEVALIELGDRSVLLALPDGSCNVNHNVMLVFTPPDKKTFQTTGKVKSIKAMEDGSLQVQIYLVQFEDKDWKRLKSLFSSRQDAINEFLRMAKK